MNTTAPARLHPADVETVLLSRAIRDGETVFVGVNSPAPMVAALLARATHAPDATLITIAGGINPSPEVLSAATSSPAYGAGSASLMDNLAFYDLVGRGGIDVTFLGGAQIDRHGRVNSSFLGEQAHPEVRFPGGGGAAYILPLAKRVIIWRASHNPGIFVENCAFVTAAGNLEAVVTPLCLFGLGSGEMTVTSIHPGVTPEDLSAATGFPINLEKVPVTEAPTPEEQAALAVIDPHGIRYSEFKYKPTPEEK